MDINEIYILNPNPTEKVEIFSLSQLNNAVNAGLVTKLKIRANLFEPIKTTVSISPRMPDKFLYSTFTMGLDQPNKLRPSNYTIWFVANGNVFGPKTGISAYAKKTNNQKGASHFEWKSKSLPPILTTENEEILN